MTQKVEKTALGPVGTLNLIKEQDVSSNSCCFVNGKMKSETILKNRLLTLKPLAMECNILITAFQICFTHSLCYIFLYIYLP